MTNADTPVETVTEQVPDGVCPRGGCTLTYPKGASIIACGECGSRFQMEPEEAPGQSTGTHALVDDEGPQEPAEPSESMEPTDDTPPEPEASAEPTGAQETEEGPAPEAPTEPSEPVSVSQEQEAIHATPEPEPQGPSGPSEPEQPPHPEDAAPPGGGDAATPAEVRTANAQGASRRTLEPIPRPDGCSKFIYQTREFQWVARDGIGNPYGPRSISHGIFDIVANAGEEGIDPVDVAVALRDSLRTHGRACTSVLQRVSAVIERIALSKFIGLMERIGDTGKVRVVEKHRGEVTAPDGMQGERRRADLESDDE